MARKQSAMKFLLQLMKKGDVAESTGELCVHSYYFIYEGGRGQDPPPPGRRLYTANFHRHMSLVPTAHLNFLCCRAHCTIHRRAETCIGIYSNILLKH